jgi:hypothetical protein
MVDPKSITWQAGETMPNPLGVVPVIPLQNRPRTRSSRNGVIAQSEIKSIIPLQDAVNKLIADLIVGSDKQALPARWATGLELDTDPVTNKPIKPQVDTAGLLVSEAPDAAFGTFQAADLRNFVVAIDMLIQHVASISRTPPHYLNASADRLSGESIKAAETGLVAKVRRKMRFFGESHEETMRLAGRIAGIDRLANADRMETIWSDPETRSDAQLMDSLLKKKEIGVPLEQLWEDAGYTPTQIARFQAMNAAADLFGPVALNEPGGASTPPAPVSP